MQKEKTLVLIKPEGAVRHLIGKIITRFEDAGLKVVGMKMVWADQDAAGKHYRQDIADKYGEKVRNTLLGHITEGPIVAMVLEGIDGIAVTRKIVGSTYPNEAPPGTIRGDFGHVSKLYANTKEIPVRNLIHASANKEDSDIEIPLWFSPEEMHSYKTTHDMISLGE
jgi:nucleoside-diphosphate kinase